LRRKREPERDDEICFYNKKKNGKSEMMKTKVRERVCEREREDRGSDKERK